MNPRHRDLYRTRNYSRWLALVVAGVLAVLAAVYVSIGLAAIGHASEREVPPPGVDVLMTATATGFKVNLNIADSKQLMLVPGIGPTRAKAILVYRTRHSFQVPADLMKVKGIGPKTYTKLKPYLVVDGLPVQGEPPRAGNRPGA